MSGVGDDALARVHQRGGQIAGGKGSGHDLAGEHFAVGGDQVGGAGSEFADRNDAAQEFVESFEIRGEVAVEAGEESPVPSSSPAVL